MITPSSNSKLRKSRKLRNRKRFQRMLGVEPLEARHLLATLVVDTRFDLVDANDDVTSLREAIAAANDETENPGRDTIQFAPSLTYDTILLGIDGFDLGTGDAIASPHGLAELVINSDVDIDASGAGLVRVGREIGSASDLETSRLDHRVLRVDSGDVTLTSLVIQRGGLPDEGVGGVPLYGAGIFNSGALTLRNSIVGDNVSGPRGRCDRRWRRYLQRHRCELDALQYHRWFDRVG